MSLEARFWAKVKKSDGCWEWTAMKRGGYGRITRDGKSNGMLTAHRLSWELAHGAIPVGLFVLHKCDNPPCVRPDHLFLGTQYDNVQDRVAKGREGDRSGEKNGRAKLSHGQVAQIRQLHTEGKSYRELALVYGVHYGHIGQIVHGKCWRNGTGTVV